MYEGGSVTTGGASKAVVDEFMADGSSLNAEVEGVDSVVDIFVEVEVPVVNIPWVVLDDTDPFVVVSGSCVVVEEIELLGVEVEVPLDDEIPEVLLVGIVEIGSPEVDVDIDIVLEIEAGKEEVAAGTDKLVVVVLELFFDIDRVVLILGAAVVVESTLLAREDDVVIVRPEDVEALEDAGADVIVPMLKLIRVEVERVED